MYFEIFSPYLRRNLNSENAMEVILLSMESLKKIYIYQEEVISLFS